ncbi:MAG: signal peptidase I [Candidatus Puniceispirillaceae bacterium]|nr:signal peptidase I [Alphaproteobacteria bacterium]
MSSEKQSSSSGIVDTLKTLLIAGAIALGFRSLVAEPFNIPSGSMIPSLLVGDYLFVTKYSYGYSRYSFPFGLAPIDGRLFGGDSTPQRGQVAVFRLPSDTSVDYIKRVIGVPGDRIQVRQGVLHINGQPVERRLVGNGRQGASGGGQMTTLYQETLPGGLTHLIQEISDRQTFDNTPEYVVPAGHYFMMGDNRDNSRDSRSSSVGFVPLENFIGEARFLFFSHDSSAYIWELWKWPSAIRFERLGNTIE